MTLESPLLPKGCYYSLLSLLLEMHLMSLLSHTRGSAHTTGTLLGAERKWMGSSWKWHEINPFPIHAVSH